MSDSGPAATRASDAGQSRDSYFIGLLFLGFVASGASTVLLSPLLPLLSSKWNLTDRAAGSLFTAQFLGSLVGSITSGWLARKIGFGRTLCVGYLCMAVYVFAAWRIAWPELIAAGAVNGLGLGLVIPSTNMVVSDAFTNARASALNLVNLSWSVGAIACPAILAIAVRLDQLQWALDGLALVTVVIAMFMLRSQLRPGGTGTEARSRFAPRLFLILASLFFLYIGTEGAVAGWLATFASRTVMRSGFVWMTAPSFFWAAMMAGRAGAPLVLRHVSETKVSAGGLCLSFVGVIGILLGTTPAMVLAGAALAGFGMCSVFPVFIAEISRCFGASASQASAYLFAISALGGAVIPWIVGEISAETGKLQTGLSVVLFGIALQVALIFALKNVGTARELA